MTIIESFGVCVFRFIYVFVEWDSIIDKPVHRNAAANVLVLKSFVCKGLYDVCVLILLLTMYFFVREIRILFYFIKLISIMDLQ